MNKLSWKPIDNTPERRRKSMIFLMCLLFSFIAWISIKLARENATVIPVSIAITNIPEDIIFTSQSDSSLIVSIRATGLKLLSSRFLGRTENMEADFSSLQPTQRKESYHYFITAAQAEARFSLLSEIPRSALTVHPDTIFFAAQEAFRKKVPVILQKNLEFQPGFKLYDIPINEPDSVEIYGPVEYKDSVTFVNTEVLNRSGVDQNIQQTLGLINPFPAQISLLQDKVDAHVPVEEFTEAMALLPVRIDCPDALRPQTQEQLVLFPDKVSVYYLVALKDDKAISPEMFEVSVSCPDTTASQHRLRPVITQKPGIVEIIRLRPAEVEYVWIKR